MALLLCLNRVLNAVSSSSPSSVRRSRLGRQGQHGAGANGGGGFEQGRKKRAKTNPNSVRFIKHKCKKKKKKKKTSLRKSKTQEFKLGAGAGLICQANNHWGIGGTFFIWETKGIWKENYENLKNVSWSSPGYDGLPFAANVLKSFQNYYHLN